MLGKWDGYMWPTLSFRQAVTDTVGLAGGGIFVQQFQCKIPREAVESSPLEVFRRCVDMALKDMV